MSVTDDQKISIAIISLRTAALSPRTDPSQWTRYIQYQSTSTVSRTDLSLLVRRRGVFSWNGTWVSDDSFSYLDTANSIWLFNCATLKSELVFPRDILQQEYIADGILSPQARFFLIPIRKETVSRLLRTPFCTVSSIVLLTGSFVLHGVSVWSLREIEKDRLDRPS